MSRRCHSIWHKKHHSCSSKYTSPVVIDWRCGVRFVSKTAWLGLVCFPSLYTVEIITTNDHHSSFSINEQFSDSLRFCPDLPILLIFIMMTYLHHHGAGLEWRKFNDRLRTEFLNISHKSFHPTDFIEKHTPVEDGVPTGKMSWWLWTVIELITM